MFARAIPFARAASASPTSSRSTARGTRRRHGGRQLHVRCAAGEITVVVGPSGCGKTTCSTPSPASTACRRAAYTSTTRCCAAPTSSRPNPVPDSIVVFQNGALFPVEDQYRERRRSGRSCRAGCRVRKPMKRRAIMMADAGLRDIEDNYPGRDFVRRAAARRDRPGADERSEGSAARRAIPGAQFADQIGDARSAARNLLQEPRDHFFHNPRSRRSDFPRPSRRHHDDPAVPAEEDPRPSISRIRGTTVC